MLVKTTGPIEGRAVDVGRRATLLLGGRSSNRLSCLPAVCLPAQVIHVFENLQQLLGYRQQNPHFVGGTPQMKTYFGRTDEKKGGGKVNIQNIKACINVVQFGSFK
ncbi:hypothetical protein ACI7RC_08545 [Brevibacillus sp. B_LB10_24]|uniref:hypothetical protein n=1 Tax=Brevibacillus sp. B_LB10_24 TaxID=3380645 RepID=UPI0038B94F43